MPCEENPMTYLVPFYVIFYNPNFIKKYPKTRTKDIQQKVREIRFYKGQKVYKQHFVTFMVNVDLIIKKNNADILKRFRKIKFKTTTTTKRYLVDF